MGRLFSRRRLISRKGFGFYWVKKQLLIYYSGGHFCRGFIENKFALTPSISVRNGTMRLFV